MPPTYKRRRGTKKYVCGECKAESFHHWIERNRAARLRCPSCGSARMELVTKEAKDETIEAQTIQVLGGTPSVPKKHE